MEGKALFTFVPCTYNKDRFMKITLDRINENFAFEVKENKEASNIDQAVDFNFIGVF